MMRTEERIKTNTVSSEWPVQGCTFQKIQEVVRQEIHLSS